MMRKSKFKTLRSLFSQRKRWRKHSLQSHGSYCLMGGLDLVHRDHYYPNERKLMKVIKALYGYSCLTVFNDAPEITFKDIKKVVRLAKV